MANLTRGFWITLAALVSAIVLVVGLIGWGLSPSSLKPRLIAAVERATGRTMTIAGRIGIEFSLVPTVVMDDVSLANPPGFSRPDMVKVARVEVSLALMPLLQHRIEVDRIALVRPDIQLETDQAGRRNWVFGRQPAPGESASAGSASATKEPVTPAVPAGPEKSGFAISFFNTNVVDGHIAWVDSTPDASSGPRRIEAGLPQLSIAVPEVGPLHLAGTVTYEGRTIGLTGRAGADETAPRANDGAPWPVALNLVSGDANMAVVGQITRPRELRGYNFTIDASVPDPSAFASLLPRYRLASCKAVTVHVGVTDNGQATPTISDLNIKAASVDIGILGIAARLENATFSAQGNSQGDAPINVSSGLSAPGLGTDSGVIGTIGDLAWLAKGAMGPVSVDLQWNAASARATVKGTIQDPVRFAGFALDVTADMPNPARVLERAPPQLKSVAFRTRLTDGTDRVPFQFTSSAGDLTGELSVSRQPRLSVSGQITSRRLDLDMLRPRPVAQTVEPGVAPAPEPVTRTTPMIPDTKLPFELIRATDADLKFTLGQVRLGGADIGGIDAALTSKDAVLRLDPFTINAPEQHLNASLTVDDGKDSPRVHLAMQAPGLSLQMLLAVLGLPPAATGAVEVRADLTGTGDTPASIAASLNGWAGVAIQGGQLDARQINAWLARLQPLHLDGADVTDLRCFAVRADARDGIVTIRQAAMNTAALIVEGSGDIDLVHETLALRLRPRTKIGGTGIALPLRVSGPMGAPSAKVDISGGGGALGGLLLGGKDIMGAAGGGDPCPAVLAAAREGAPQVPGAKP